MADREKVIRRLECVLDALVQDEHAFAENGVVMSSWQDRAKRIDAIREAIALLKAQELWYTPREVRNALMAYGQHDPNIKLGEVIKYNPVQIEDILMNEREATRPVTPHMVDWGIYECPKCKTRVDKTYNFCKYCRRPVKWE